MSNSALTIIIQQSGPFSEGIVVGKIQKELQKELKTLGTISVRICESESPFFKDFIEIMGETVTIANQSGDIDMKLLVISSEIIYGKNFLNSLDPQKISLELKEKFPRANIIWAIFDYYPLLRSSQPNIDFCLERTSLDPNKTLVKEIKIIWKKLFN